MNEDWVQVKCNVKWPICHQILEKNKQFRRDIPLFIFRTNNLITVIDNYFCDKNKLVRRYSHNQEAKAREKQKYVMKSANDADVPEDFVDNLVIGRHHHVCNVDQYKSLQTQQQMKN